MTGLKHVQERETYLSRDLRLNKKYVYVSSFILIFIETGGIAFDRINFLGIVGKIDNPMVVHWSLIAVLLFSIFRYFQYFISDCTGYLITSYQRIRNLVFQKKIKSLIVRKLQPYGLLERHPDFGGVYTPPAYPYFKSSGFLKLSMTAERVPYRDGEGKAEQDVEIEANIVMDLAWQYIKTWFKFIFQSPVLFELLFPFLFGLGTLVYVYVVHC